MQKILLVVFLLRLSLAWADVREDINQKRQGVWFFDKKAFALSQEFLRLDSTYYVGWIYEAGAKYERAQDEIGYFNAIRPLEKALKYIEKDFNAQLKIRTDDVSLYVPAYQVQQDYCMIMYLLYECNMNIERQEIAFNYLKKFKKKGLQKTFFIEPNNSMSWILHRCRVFTNSKYDFCKNSIEENELAALRHIDSSMYQVRKFYNWNAKIFPAEYINEDFYYNYHNKALIYTYLGVLDSAEHYYNFLKPTRYFSDNNYAYLKLVTADFRECERYFNIEKTQDNLSQKQTKEYNYMLGILNVYKGDVVKNLEELDQFTKSMGSTPGYGWNNIALTRASYYAGLLSESDKYQERAEKFKELHINTSWSPEQYDYAIALYKYLNSERRLSSLFFQDKFWYLNVATLLKAPKYFIQKYTNRFVLANRFGTNPEREIAFYKLFNSESVMSFDEVWLTIEGFNTNFFLNKYNQYLKVEKRENIKRYYKYMIGRLLLKKGEYDLAIRRLHEVLNDKQLDPIYEKLLIARCYEGLALAYKSKEDVIQSEKYINQIFELYPSLLPFSKLQQKMHLTVTGNTEAPIMKEIIKDINGTSIKWINEPSNGKYPEVKIALVDNKQTKDVRYEVKLTSGTIYSGQIRIEPSTSTGKKLAYALFNIPINEIEEVEKNDYWKILIVFGGIFILWLAWYIKKTVS